MILLIDSRLSTENLDYRTLSLKGLILLIRFSSFLYTLYFAIEHFKKKERNSHYYNLGRSGLISEKALKIVKIWKIKRGGC